MGIFSYIQSRWPLATSLGYSRACGSLGGKADYARGGGAGTLVGMGAASMSDLAQKKPTPAAVLDGATMILMELAFVLLWAGIIMGAICDRILVGAAVGVGSEGGLCG